MNKNDKCVTLCTISIFPIFFMILTVISIQPTIFKLYCKEEVCNITRMCNSSPGIFIEYTVYNQTNAGERYIMHKNIDIYHVGNITCYLYDNIVKFILPKMIYLYIYSGLSFLSLIPVIAVLVYFCTSQERDDDYDEENRKENRKEYKEFVS